MSMRSTILLSLFVGPAVALLDQSALYFLVAPTRSHPSWAGFVLLTAVAAAVVVAALVAASRTLRARDYVPPVDRFLATMAVASNLFFLALVVIGFGLPAIVLAPTD